MNEYITHEPQSPDAWVCLCNNTPDDYGFYPCLQTGELVEPNDENGWTSLYRCDKCQRIVEAYTLAVVGVTQRAAHQ